MKTIRLILFVLIASTATLNAQWAQGEGNGYFKLSSWYLVTDQHFTDSGDLDPNVTRSQLINSLYAEYGVSRRLDIVAYIPFMARATRNSIVSGTTGEEILPGEAINALGDINLGADLSLYKKKRWAGSARLILGLPTGEDQGGSDGSFQTGDGEFNQYLSLRLGHSFAVPGNNWYGKFNFGFNNRTNGFSDELRFGLESGVSVLKRKLLILSRLQVVESLQNGNRDATTAPGNIFANNVEYWSVGGEVNYTFAKNLGISFGVAGAISGRLIAANPSWSGGIYYTLR